MIKKALLSVLAWLLLNVGAYAQTETWPHYIGLGASPTVPLTNQCFVLTDSTFTTKYHLCSGYAAALGLGTAATQNTGTSGANLGLLNSNLTFSGNVTFSGVPVLSGLSSGTCVSQLVLDSGNHIVTTSCGGGGSSLTTTDGTHTVTSTTQQTFGNGFVVGGTGGLATINSTVPDATKTSSYTIAAGDMSGQVNYNGTSLTATIPAISSSVLAAGMTVTIANFNSSALTIASTPAINGCSTWSTSLPQNAFLNLTSNGTSLDCVGSTTTGSGGITQLTGDVTAGPGSGSQAATLATVNSSPGTFAVNTTNGKGLVTGTANLSGDVVTSGAAATIQSGAVTSSKMSSTGSAGSYTSMNATIDSAGRVTSASNGLAAIRPFYFFPTTQIATNTPEAFTKVTAATVIDNFTLSAGALTCSTNPTIEFDDCGTSTTCASPTTISSGTITAAGTAFFTALSTTVPSGDFVAWKLTAGSCTASSFSGVAEAHVGTAPCGPLQADQSVACNAVLPSMMKI